jgi:hypothetical protein
MDAKEVQVTEETSEGLNYTTKEVLAVMNSFGAWFVGISMLLALVLVLRVLSGV